MTDRDELNSISFQIIAAVGSARSLYLEAVRAAKEGNLARSQELLDEGDECFSQGHHAHASIIQREAAGEPTSMTLMLTHAEDQLMSAESIGLVAREFIEVYREQQELRALIGRFSVGATSTAA